MKIPQIVRIAVLCTLLAACSEPGAEPDGTPELRGVRFGTAELRIPTPTDTITLPVEVAANDAQRAQGLMERTRLDADAGMLFTYPADQSPDAGFWMFRTRIPLEIAFLDASGRIVAIERMEPCSSPDPQWCPVYPPGVPYRAALEVNPGFFARHGLGVGDHLLLPS